MKRTKTGYKLFTKYKYNSVFIRTFLMLLILFSILVSIIYSFFIRVSNENVKEKVLQSNLNMLEQTKKSTEMTLDNLSSLMEVTLFNKDVVASYIAPTQMNYEKNVTLLSQLRDTNKNIELINSTFLYVKKSGLVYTSNNKINEFKTFTNKYVINDFLNTPYKNIYQINKIKTDIRLINNEMYLIQDFPQNKLRNGVLVFHINKDKLYDLLLGTSKELNSNIYIYDDEYRPVFSNMIEYDIDVDIVKELNDIKFNDGSGYINRKNINGIDEIYFYSKSDKIDWTFIYPIPVSMLDLTIDITAKLLITLIFIFILVCFGFSYFITSSIYKPLSQLIDSISINKNTSARNEYEFLGKVYYDALSNQDNMNKVIENISPMVLERMFFELIKEYEISSDTIESTLNDINSKFKVNDKYIMAVISVKELEGDSLSAVEKNVCGLSVLNITRKFLYEMDKTYSMRTEDNLITAIMSFEASESDTNIMNKAKEAFDLLTEAFMNLPYTINLGIGEIYSSIKELNYAYKTAYEDLKFRIYFQDQKDKKDKAVENDLNNFIADLKKIMLDIDNNNIDSAKAKTLTMIEEIRKSVYNIESVRYILKILNDSFMGKLLSKKVDISTFDNIIDRSINKTENIESLLEDTKIFSNEVFSMLSDNMNSRNIIYINRAKEYINEHYDDSTISLVTVADYVGISSSYLSKLFKNELNINYLDYLNEYRITKAKYLLENSELSVKDIGYKTGFNSMATFFRLFKKYTGLTPKDYKTQK